jgi:hypothetical protein
MGAISKQNAAPERFDPSFEETSVSGRAVESRDNADMANPLGALGAAAEFRDHTVSAVQRVLEAGLSIDGDIGNFHAAVASSRSDGLGPDGSSDTYGVDRSAIRRLLDLSPAERLRLLVQEAHNVADLDRRMKR